MCILTIWIAVRDTAKRAFKTNILQVSDSKIIKMIPFYVRPERLLDGFCPHHAQWRVITKMIVHKRKEWHADCICLCDFCVQCNCGHDCQNHNVGFCLQCFNVKCPIEHTNEDEQWSTLEYETVLQPRATKDGNVHHC